MFTVDLDNLAMVVDRFDLAINEMIQNGDISNIDQAFTADDLREFYPSTYRQVFMSILIDRFALSRRDSSHIADAILL